jgi:anti-sigma B factor antagonist
MKEKNFMEETVDFEIVPRQGGVTFVFKTASLSSAEGITAARGQILNYITKEKPKLVIVNFEKVKFFSSQVLGMLVNIRNTLNINGGDFRISGINPQLYRVFRITNLDKIFEFLPDSENAVK